MNVEDFGAGEIFSKPVSVDGWVPDYENDSWSWFEVYEQNDDRHGTAALVVRNGDVSKVFIDGRGYDANGFEDYAADNTEDETGELLAGAFTEDEFSAMFDVYGDEHGCEGPMMNYWYPVDSIDDDDEAADAASKLVNLPLCVVEVQGSYGLALTGGGMDMSWYIVAAFVRLGLLPPLHFVQGLSMPIDSAPDAAPALIAACRHTLDVAHQRIGWERERFVERFQTVKTEA